MNEQFSFRERQIFLDQLKTNCDPFDLVIIGGGITGAGVLRDASSRGMRAVLIESNDFASGTSSRSSKLIHGGIRYLENLEFGLVYEALSERRLLFDMAPHLVHPLRFLLPLYEDSRVGMVKMGLGMWLYDALSLFEAPKMHERLSAEETLSHSPILRSQGLVGSYIYSDAYMDDDRLVLETLRSAYRLGGVCVNYVSAVGAEMEDGQVRAVRCRDEISGQEVQIKARHFVSTVGPWTDQLGQQLFGPWGKILRPSKGIHLTFHRDRLPLREAVVMAADKENRIIFAIPRHEMIIIGTTDTDYSEDPAAVCSREEDVNYLLKIVDQFFPGARIVREDILASYAGVRPLVNDGSLSESKTSREHLILTDPRNMTFVAGGKYTTYRRMAEQTVQTTLESFPIEDRARFNRNQTKEPLNPLVTRDSHLKCQLKENEWSKAFALPLKDVRFLWERHGEEVFRLLNYHQLLSKELSGSESLRWGLEAHFAIDQTMCLSLRDFYLRRSPLFLSRRDHGFGLLKPLADLFAERLSWSDAQRQEQIDALYHHREKEMAWVKN